MTLLTVERPLGRFTHQPWERKRYRVDYSKNLAASETLSSVAFIVDPLLPAPPLVATNGVFDATGKQLVFYVSGGVDKTRYKVTIRVTTSAGQQLEDELEFWVEER